MSIDFETAIAMQRICTGETIELARGRIAGEVIDIDKATESFGSGKAGKCREFYNELVSDETKKPYDADMLLEETDAIKKEFDDFIKSNGDDDSFRAMFDSISEFFMHPPFEGLDNIEYGVNEVCVFSVLEYFKRKTSEDHDHEQIRREYRDSIAERTYEEVGDHWIKVYDDLQKRYDMIGEDFEGERAFSRKLAGCCIVAVSAIRDQDEFSLDMAQAGAGEKGRDIADAYIDGTYKEDESVFTDNVVRLYEFVWENIRTENPKGK